MCGIFGIREETEKKPDVEILKKMLLAQNHRGPDYSSFWIYRNIGMGHNRLKIIDLSPKANQPMLNEDKSIALVFNGEIYNYKTIKTDLEHKGYKFKSNSDTEVLLHGYDEYGKNILNLINGMFAFCIYDKKRDLFFLAKDRFGKKPLFYYFDKKTFVFSSELKTIKEYPGINLDVNKTALDLFLTLQYIPAPHSIYSSIKQLDASEYMILSNNEIKISKYYDIAIDPSLSNISYDDAKVLIKKKIITSVKQRMLSDVPLGSFLSGGIDSSIITSILAKESTKKIPTISIGFNEKKYSELGNAQSIAKKYNTDHHEYVLDINDTYNSIEDIISYYDQPFGDASAIPTYFLSKLTKKHVTVALSGDGGDEVFCGYQRYHLDSILNRVNSFIPSFLLMGLFNTFNVFHPLKNIPIERNWVLGLKRLSQVLSTDKKASIIRWGSFYNFKHKQKLFKEYQWENDAASEYIISIFNACSNIKDWMARTQYTDLFSYAPGGYLVKTDIVSMRNALEVRCPFLDYELVDTVFSINPSFNRKYNSGKYMLKQMFFSDLTKEVLDAPKQGFGIPLSEWFKGKMLNMLMDYLSTHGSFCSKHFNKKYINTLINDHKNNYNDHSKKLYLLLVLEIWNKRNR